MTKPGEAELFKQARAGDKAAFSRLQSRLEPQARRFIWRLVGRIDEEDDIVQNAFVALYLNLGRLDSAAGLRPFLFRVVRNQCYDLLRRVGCYEVISIERPGPTPRETRLILADESWLPEEVCPMDITARRTARSFGSAARAAEADFDPVRTGKAELR